MERSVLILDEDKDYCHLLHEIYTQADYRVKIGETSWDVASKLKELQSSIVVIDYKFGALRGVDLIRIIHKESPESKVIVASAPLAEQTIRAMIVEEIDGLFTKPLKPISFLKRSSELLAGNLNIGVPGSHIKTRSPFGISGFRMSSFPGRSLASKRFGEKLYQAKDFKSRLLLIGREGSPFRTVAGDLIGVNPENHEALSFFEAYELDADVLESQVKQLKSEGFQGVTAVILQAEKLADEEVRVIREIQASGGLAERFEFPVRFIFCIRGELDALYDRQEISTSVYMTLGATELVIPSLNDCVEDIPQIAQNMIREFTSLSGIEKMITLEESAKEYLKGRQWENEFDELEVVLEGIIAKSKGGRVTEGHFHNESGDLEPVEESVSPLRQHLMVQRNEYIQAVIKMSRGDLDKASTSLGFDVDEIKRFLNR